MPKEVVDFLEEGLNELKSDIHKMREQMTREHRLLGERVAKLEERQRVMMWVTAPAGVVVGMVLREIIGRWF